MDSALSDRLTQNGLFHRIDMGALEHLLDDCTRLRLRTGAILLEPERANDNLYVVVGGELHVHLSDRELPAHSVLGIGECAGEMSLIDGHGVSALVIAAADTELLVIPHPTLWALIDRSHGFARNLLAMLSGRMRRDNLALVATASRSLEFEQAAGIDALTGLHNRRWLADAFPRTLRRCEQDGSPLCLVMADIDHFKRLNDEQGHLTGDAVLRVVARRLAESLRPQDLIARYGGEEFAILLPKTSTEEGLHIAERLRQAVADMPLTVVAGGPLNSVTISCGIAPLGLDISVEKLIDTADAALYRAKANGRNRIEVAA